MQRAVSSQRFVSKPATHHSTQDRLRQPARHAYGQGQLGERLVADVVTGRGHSIRRVQLGVALGHAVFAAAKVTPARGRRGHRASRREGRQGGWGRVRTACRE